MGIDTTMNDLYGTNFERKRQKEVRWKPDDNAFVIKAETGVGDGDNAWSPVKCLLEQGLLK